MEQYEKQTVNKYESKYFAEISTCIWILSAYFFGSGSVATNIKRKPDVCLKV